MDTHYTLYFVLNGLCNGVDGEYATTAGFGVQQPDGWYYLLNNGALDGVGPFTSMDKAGAAAALACSVHVLGHTFTPMESADWDGLAGAAPGSLICYPPGGKVTLVYNPAAGTVTEIHNDGYSGDIVWQGTPQSH